MTIPPSPLPGAPLPTAPGDRRGRSRVLRGGAALGALLLGLGAAPPAAPALVCPAALRCTCIEAPAPRAAMLSADAVFLGTVDAVRQVPLVLDGEDSGLIALRVTLRVHAAWKGLAPGVETVTLTTGAGGGDCGYPFEPRTAYLVYAQGRGEEMSTSVCSRTAPAQMARHDFEQLGHPPMVRHQ